LHYEDTSPEQVKTLESIEITVREKVLKYVGLSKQCRLNGLGKSTTPINTPDPFGGWTSWALEFDGIHYG
jgi:hypothetical protein